MNKNKWTFLSFETIDKKQYVRNKNTVLQRNSYSFLLIFENCSSVYFWRMFFCLFFFDMSPYFCPLLHKPDITSRLDYSIWQDNLVKIIKTKLNNEMTRNLFLSFSIFFCFHFEIEIWWNSKRERMM